MDKVSLEDFGSSENIYLVPPYIENKHRILDVWKSLGLKNSIFICSSGTSNTGGVKSFAFSKCAILENAKAVNRFLGVKQGERWLASLPPFHIGGLAIWARSFLNNTPPLEVEGKWNSALFQRSFTYASLVPTQLYDLIKSDIKPHQQLKGVFIGGDFLATELRELAVKQGWPLIITYGMTEVSSQLASRFVDSSFDNWLKILDIHTVTSSGVTSPSLASKKIFITKDSVAVNDICSPFKLSDNYELKNGSLKPMGRADSFFKYKGKLFNFLEILDQVQKVFLTANCYLEAGLVLVKDDKYGMYPVIRLESKRSDLVPNLRDLLRENKFLDYFNIKIELCDKVERTLLGKLKTT